MQVRIAGLSQDDELILQVAALKETFRPSRCPHCTSTNIAVLDCVDGSVCHAMCGGGGRKVVCNNYEAVLSEEECEEVEES